MIKPYYENNGITVYNGDCLEIMPRLERKFDLILTDPPYGVNYNDDGDLASRREFAFGGNKKNFGTRPIAEDSGKEAIKLFEKFLKISKNKLLKGGACCCCGGGGGPRPLFAEWALLMDEIIGFKHAVVWDKGGLGMGIHYRRNYEFVLIAQNGTPAHRWNGGNKTANVWRINRIIPSAGQHPTEKPVELMQKILQIHSNRGDLCLDPFMGHGTTLVAAAIEKRKAIGIEIEEKYCEVAVKRVERILNQGTLEL
jgi:DNA modification methylase